MRASYSYLYVYPARLPAPMCIYTCFTAYGESESDSDSDDAGSGALHAILDEVLRAQTGAPLPQSSRGPVEAQAQV